MPILASEPNIYPANLLDLHDFNEFLPKDSECGLVGTLYPVPSGKKLSA